MKNFNYYAATTSEENTIACRNNGTEIEAHGSGAYVGKPAVIEVIAERDGFVLKRTDNSHTGKATFRLYWDGECISMLDNEKEALLMFEDFAPAPKRKAGRPKKNAA